MQKTNLRVFIENITLNLSPLISDSWRLRSIILLSLLSGYYLTNSFISYLLGKNFNTIFLAILIVLVMEIIIRTRLLSIYSKLSFFILIINNLRIGSTYALILEAFKLGS